MGPTTLPIKKFDSFIDFLIFLESRSVLELNIVLFTYLFVFGFLDAKPRASGRGQTVTYNPATNLTTVAQGPGKPVFLCIFLFWVYVFRFWGLCLGVWVQNN